MIRYALFLLSLVVAGCSVSQSLPTNSKFPDRVTDCAEPFDRLGNAISLDAKRPMFWML